jgi:hypothetical protein
MNTFLEDSLQADLDLLKATEKANKAIIAHFNLLEHPYRGGPDFRFLYTTDQVKEAIAKCILSDFSVSCFQPVLTRVSAHPPMKPPITQALRRSHWTNGVSN